MSSGLPRTTLSYSGDALRSFNVQPTSQLRRDVRKRLFSLRIWIPGYKHVNMGNSNVKQSFDHIVTVRKSVPGVKLGVMNCQSISGKLDFVFDHIKEYQLDIVALTETWLSSEEIVRTNTLLINVSLMDTPFIIHLTHLVGEGWSRSIGEQCNQGDL